MTHVDTQPAMTHSVRLWCCFGRVEGALGDLSVWMVRFGSGKWGDLSVWMVHFDSLIWNFLLVSVAAGFVLLWNLRWKQFFLSFETSTWRVKNFLAFKNFQSTNCLENMFGQPVLGLKNRMTQFSCGIHFTPFFSNSALFEIQFFKVFLGRFYFLRLKKWKRNEFQTKFLKVDFAIFISFTPTSV